METAWGMAAAMTFALTIAALAGYPVKYYLLIPLGLERLELISFVFVITLAVLLGELFLKKIRPALHEKIARLTPLTLANSAGLGVALLNVQQAHGLAGSLFFGLGSGTGFGLVMVTAAAMQQRLEGADVPQPFRGVSILLITFGIVSMAFMGFTAMVNL